MKHGKIRIFKLSAIVKKLYQLLRCNLTFLVFISFVSAITLLMMDFNKAMLEENSLTHVLSAQDKPVWLLDAFNQERLPKRFRTTKTTFASNSEEFEVEQNKPLPSRQGLDSLQISGSAQFSAGEFKIFREKIGKNIVLVDLRQETHFLLDGAAISLFAYQNAINHARTPKAIEKEENKYIKSIQGFPSFSYSIATQKRYGTIKATTPVTKPIKKVMSLSDFSQTNDVDYIRFYVQDRHIPTQTEVNRFVDFVNHLPEDTWLHFFCRGGSGRTTTFMVMYDMLKNAHNPTLTFEDFIQRHKLLGGADLFAPIEPDMPDWLQTARLERQVFIRDFYETIRI